MLNLIIVSALIFVVAVVMTMVGKGGGNFYVVILTMAGIPMHEAATTGQFILFSASVAAILIFQKNRSISWTLAVVIGAFSSLSALGGGYFSHIFEGFSLKLIFAVMLFLAGILLLRQLNISILLCSISNLGMFEIASDMCRPLQEGSHE